LEALANLTDDHHLGIDMLIADTLVMCKYN